jgi:hypothetical protein
MSTVQHDAKKPFKCPSARIAGSAQQKQCLHVIEIYKAHAMANPAAMATITLAPAAETDKEAPLVLPDWTVPVVAGLLLEDEALEDDRAVVPEAAELAPEGDAVAVTTTPEPAASVDEEVSGPAGTAVAVAVTTATPLWDESEVAGAFSDDVEGFAREDVIVNVRTPFPLVVVEVATIVSEAGVADDAEAEAELECGEGCNERMEYRQ